MTFSYVPLKLGDFSSLPLRPCLVRKNFQDFPSYRIFGRMYGALNIDENKN